MSEKVRIATIGRAAVLAGLLIAGESAMSLEQPSYRAD